jgi:hypothetical protein
MNKVTIITKEIFNEGIEKIKKHSENFKDRPYLNFDSLTSWSAPIAKKEKNKSHIPWLKGK